MHAVLPPCQIGCSLLEQTEQVDHHQLPLAMSILLQVNSLYKPCKCEHTSVAILRKRVSLTYSQPRVCDYSKLQLMWCRTLFSDVLCKSQRMKIYNLLK